jgi:hypothetical protein
VEIRAYVHASAARYPDLAVEFLFLSIAASFTVLDDCRNCSSRPAAAETQ